MPRQCAILIFPVLLTGLIVASVIPEDRLTIWNPGLNAVGGIPLRTQIFITLLPSGGDDTEAIQSALDECPAGQVVLLGPGDFRISTEGLIMNRSGITLRGSGPDLTRLLKDPEINWYPVICMGNRWSGDKTLSHSIDLASDGIKGSKTVILKEAPDPSLTPGELVLIDQITDPDITEWSPDSPPGDGSRAWFCRMDRSVSQVMEIESVSGARITMTTPFHISFLTENNAQISRYGEDWLGPDPRPATRYSGIEDLYLEEGTNGNITLEVCAYCWVKNVESTHTDGSSIDLTSCFRCEIRDSYIHTSDNPNPGGGGYLLSLSRGSADNLIENNAIWNANKVMVMRATGGGNVIGYNYFEDGWIEYQPGWVESGANASHMTTAHYELFEGNQAFNFDGESTWGNAVYITALRNHFTGKRRSVPPLELTDEGFPRAVGLHHGHWWYTFTGNVLGTRDMDPSPYAGTIYESSDPLDEDRVVIWALGMGADWGPPDPKVRSTLIRHGNFDYLTNTVKWEDFIPDHDIPNSLYLSGKPAFFSNKPWPWVEPEAEIRLHTLPARERFDFIHGFTTEVLNPSEPQRVKKFRLSAAPNPFNPSTIVTYQVNGFDHKAWPVRIAVYDISGRLISILVDESQYAGEHRVRWNAAGCPSGLYIIGCGIGESIMTQKVLLMK